MQQDYLIYGFLSLLPLYHLFTLVLLVLNIRWMYPRGWHNLSTKEYDRSISICIPARNEEASIAQCLISIIKATRDKPIPIFVLDDHSEDRTASIVKELQKDNVQITLIRGKELPLGWRGKPWACYQLSQQVTTDFILFLDADVQIENTLLPRITHSFRKNSSIGMVSFWPEQHLKDTYQKWVIPWVYRALLTHLPSLYQHQRPSWMPLNFYKRLKHLFAAANGQCIAFKKQDYLAINGHQSVKNEIVEDIWLGKSMLKKGFSTQILSGRDSISCKMYDTDEEMFEGFRKNFFVGFGKNVALFVLAGTFHWLMYLIPFLLLFHPTTLPFAICGIIISIFTDLLLKSHFKWPKWTSLFYPLGVIWFSKLAVKCINDHRSNTSASWKGRKL